MRIAIIAPLLVGALGVCWLGAAQEQSPKPILDQQLRKQYPLTRVGTNGVVTQAGTILAVQEDGIKAIPSSYQGYLANNVRKGGRIKMNMVQRIGGTGNYLQEARLVQVGEKAYLTKVEVKDTEIVFSLQSCGSCNPAGADPNDAPFRASLAFQFAKGYLATADFKDVQETISSVFAIDNSATAQPAGTDTTSLPAQPAPAPTPAATPAAQPQQAEPPTITIGQTKDQVVAALGQPDRVAKIGNKEICFYKDMKITFVDGKVSDIQ